MRCAVSAPKDESLSVCIGRGLQRHRCMHHRPPPPPKGKGHVCVCLCVMVEGHKTEQHQSSWTCGAVSSKRSEAELNRPFIKCCSVWRVCGQRGIGQARPSRQATKRRAQSRVPSGLIVFRIEEGGDDTLPCVVQTGSVSCRVQARSKVQQGAATAKPGGHEALKR